MVGFDADLILPQVPIAGPIFDDISTASNSARVRSNSGRVEVSSRHCLGGAKEREIAEEEGRVLADPKGTTSRAPSEGAVDLARL
jgi:hypothetical protein